MLKIGKVAEKTGISIRSLRHYDEIGLLKPSDVSEAGYRLYSEKNILRLQQIVSLKQMKLPLKKIKEMLIDDSMNLEETLKLQREFLAQQLEQQKALCQKLDQLIKRMEFHETFSLDLIYQTMENIKMLENYYSKEQLESIDNRWEESESKAYAQAWIEVFTGLQTLQEKDVDPTDPQTKQLAQKSRELVSEFTTGDQGIEDGLNNMYRQEGGAQMFRNHGLPVTDELYAYYEVALRAHAPKGKES